MKIYLDSNVYISSVREEIDNSLGILFHNSDLFFALCKKNKYTLILSSNFFKEVKSVVSLEKDSIESHLLELGIPVEVINDTGKYKQLAHQIMQKTGIHFADAFHVAIAKSTNCNFIVTWNIKDFRKAGEYVECKTPEEFIEDF